MTNSTIDEAQRKAARVAGSAFLLAMAIVVLVNYGITFRLVIPGNAVETTQNIMANETLFHISVAGNLIYATTVVVLLSALYVILKPVNRNLALVATFCRLIYVFTWGVAALYTLGALRLLGGAAYLPVFGADQLQTLVMLNLDTSLDAYYTGLPFWGLASTINGYLLFRSRYVPRALAAFGVLSSAWCVICAYAFISIPRFDTVVNANLFDVPMVIFELALGLWLLLKGLRGPLRPTIRADN
ncbi:MAG: DUF4386 domain-containing protein [Candidatus Dormibacteraeota bacterium]|nr:DUF4386 domain-containing protein [Candidatus Dormibacteraeota bacterium]